MEQGMRKLLTFLLVLLPVQVFAATYYISPNGSDSTGNGSYSNPWATLDKAFPSMSGGDTLICKNGTYTGDLNKIGTGAKVPPTGSSGAWTIIKAENDGMAIFDGENARNMFYSVPNASVYWQFEGLTWCKTTGCNVGMWGADYVKFLRCAAYDCGPGNFINFNFGAGCSYVLVENCYAWGGGRYKFLFGSSENCILRQCVGRSDWDNALNEPIGGISVYSAQNTEIQNCIIVDGDGDLVGAYYNVGERAGAFNCPATAAPGNGIWWRNNIALNCSYGGMCSSALSGSSNVLFDNCVMWDVWSKTKWTDNQYINLAYGYDTNYINCTVGNIPTTTYVFRTTNETNETNIENCIIYNATSTFSVFHAIQNESYNSFYKIKTVKNHTSTGYWTDVSTTDIQNIDPIWSVSNSSGALKYIVRTESGNGFSTAGLNGAQIGANATTLIGTQGTLYGETGYNTDTGVSMWPFPYEDIIKERMAAYTHTDASCTVSGDRGFASTTATQLDGTTPVTLTSYIWEYLGNEMPAEIYGKSEPARRRLSISGGVTITGGVQLK